MLLPRERKILALLYQCKNGMTTTELANSIHVSSRTIKEDVKNLKTGLPNNHCVIGSKTGKGIWLSYTEEGKNYLNELLLNEDVSAPVSPEIRKYYVAIQLLDAEGFISMEKISEAIFVSKSTIVNDINKLIPLFKQQSLRLEKKVKYGIRLIGSESQLRITRAYIVRKIVTHQGNQILSKLQPFFANIDLGVINTILQEVEENFGFILSDSSYTDLMIHLSIIVRRLRKGAICPVDLEELKRDKAREEWKICEFLAKKLNESFDVELFDGDKSYILLNITGAKLLGDSKLGLLDKSNKSDLLFETWEKIVAKAGAMYRENLSEDDTFIRGLFVHLKAMFHRIQNQVHLENPLKSVIKEELVYEFEVATYIAKLLYLEYNIDLGEDEICDIALYFGANLERKKAMSAVEKPCVTVVCGSGTGTSQFFQAKLKSIFPNIVVNKIIPISRIEAELEYSQQNFIISTVPLTIDNVDVLHVSPMLSSKDIILIENKLHPDKAKSLMQNKEHYHTLFSQFAENITLLKSNCRTKDEIINTLGTQLVENEYVKDTYISSVFEREKLAPTSIGNTFAIPHAFEGNILKQGIGLMTLKRPIEWGGYKVQIILMLAIDVRNNESFQSIFEELACITKDLSIVEDLLMANDFQDVNNILKCLT